MADISLNMLGKKSVILIIQSKLDIRISLVSSNCTLISSIFLGFV